MIIYMICMIVAVAQLPFVLQEGGAIFNLMVMILCTAQALWHLIRTPTN